MAKIINIETSTEVCSVALANKGEVIALREYDKDKSHAAKLTVFIDEVLKEASVTMKDLDAVSVSEGPGSYTGLRIGVSVAKGLCFALNLPLIAVSSLKAMALRSINLVQSPENDLFCPLMDARRMEVYTALFDYNLETRKPTEAKIIDDSSFADVLSKQKVHFFGNGATKCRNVITSPNALFDVNITCSAADMAPLSYQAFLDKAFKDVAYFEPFYLKDFIATKPKRKII